VLTDKNHTLPGGELVALVRDARQRTLSLIEDLDDGELEVPPISGVNPPRWELGHVAFFFEVFFVRLLGRAGPILEGADEMFDSFHVAHDTRWSLPLPSRAGTLSYMEDVLDEVLEIIGDGDADPATTYLALLGTLHEDMHGEALTYTRQTLEYAPPVLHRGPAPSGGGPLPGDVAIPGGSFRLGADPEAAFVFDNEKWAHSVEVPTFHIARAPVTNEEYAGFVDAGGYRQREWWDLEGWRFRSRTGLRHPIYWTRGSDGWLRRQFDRAVPLDPHHPASHVSWHEASAYCRWANRRLPTEAEWDKACTFDLHSGTKGVIPWNYSAPLRSDANLDSTQGGVVDVGCYPESESASGCRQMLGNVWEWTSSAFYPFPGYLVDFPYREYSAPWFGYQKVLKGGGWATRSRLARPTYRNFFLPERADIIAGFRTCAL